MPWYGRKRRRHVLRVKIKRHRVHHARARKPKKIRIHHPRVHHLRVHHPRVRRPRVKHTTSRVHHPRSAKAKVVKHPGTARLHLRRRMKVQRSVKADVWKRVGVFKGGI